MLSHPVLYIERWCHNDIIWVWPQPLLLCVCHSPCVIDPRWVIHITYPAAIFPPIVTCSRTVWNSVEWHRMAQNGCALTPPVSPRSWKLYRPVLTNCGGTARLGECGKDWRGDRGGAVVYKDVRDRGNIQCCCHHHPQLPAVNLSHLSFIPNLMLTELSNLFTRNWKNTKLDLFLDMVTWFQYPKSRWDR